MFRLPQLVIILSCFICAQCTPPKPDAAAANPLRVPSEWINELHHLGTTHDSLKLLKQFEGFIEPASLDGASDTSHLSQGALGQIPPGLLNPVFINLDEDPEVELVGIFGYARREPTLAVFKKIKDSWYLLYHESFFVHNEEPEMIVINNQANPKTFGFRFLYETGSGIYRDAFRFYKLINNSVYRCLELPHEARLIGWGTLLNQEVETRYRFSSSATDAVEVTMKYRYFTLKTDENGLPASADDGEATMLTGEKNARFEWDAGSQLYRLIPSPAGLTAGQIACLSSFGHDSLFCNAFAAEINTTLKKGPPELRRNLHQYLSTKKTPAAAPPQTLPETKRTGSTHFYTVPRN